MRIGCFYDGETTGIPDFKSPSDGVGQPHIVQLAAKIIDLDTRQEFDHMNMISKPDGWEIPDDMTAIHGITTERAAEVGIDEELVVGRFFDMWLSACDVDEEALRIGHNESFDRRLIRIATKRIPGLNQFEEPWHAVPKPRSFCTMHKSRKACDLGKVPKLSEAYQHFTGKELVDAHDAMVDVDACIAVYFGIIDSAE
jgi:DNA polymerase-3 subunit epsilon